MKKKTVVEHWPWRGAASQRAYTDNVIAAAAPSWRRCLRGFAIWLEQDRGLALSSITLRVASARAFVSAQDGGGGVRTLRGGGVIGVEDFFIDYAKNHGPAARRSMQAAVRLFLRFASERKWVKPQMADSVPSMFGYRLSSVPRGLSADDVRALIMKNAKRSTRDHAIVLLLATYGIRRGQVSLLRLEHIDWRNRTITFLSHKGGKVVQHELVSGVAIAVSEYLQHERPKVDERALFLRGKLPYLPLGPSAVTAIVCNQLRQLELTCSPCGPHALRHAFATRLLHAGQPLKVIADLLGHRSLAEVGTYAKVDHPRLLKVAAQWPEVGA